MTLKDKYLRVDFEGKSVAVPLERVAYHRAKWYADEFGGSIGRSLDEDTIPLFEAVPAMAIDWAARNMNWEDLARRS